MRQYGSNRPDSGAKISAGPNAEQPLRNRHSLGHRGEVLVRGTQSLMKNTPVHLAGSTLGGYFLKM
jgi:hypothetical protein